MVNSKALFRYNRHYYLFVVLPILSNHIGLVLSSYPANPPYPRTESTLGTRDTIPPVCNILHQFYMLPRMLHTGSDPVDMRG
jgi:hypothetical protein